MSVLDWKAKGRTSKESVPSRALAHAPSLRARSTTREPARERSGGGPGSTAGGAGRLARPAASGPGRPAPPLPCRRRRRRQARCGRRRRAGRRCSKNDATAYGRRPGPSKRAEERAVVAPALHRAPGCRGAVERVAVAAARLRRPVGSSRYRAARRPARRHADERAHVHAHAGELPDRAVRRLGRRRARRAGGAMRQGTSRVALLVLDAFVHQVELLHRHLAAALGRQRRPGPLLGLRAAAACQVATALRASSSSVMVTVRGSAVPSRTPFSQANRSSDPTRPRLSVTSSFLYVFGTLRTVLHHLVAVAVLGVARPRTRARTRPRSRRRSCPREPSPWRAAERDDVVERTVGVVAKGRHGTASG